MTYNKEKKLIIYCCKRWILAETKILIIGSRISNIIKFSTGLPGMKRVFGNKYLPFECFIRPLGE